MTYARPPRPIRTPRALLRRHGVLIYALYYLSEFVSWASIGHWLRWLPRGVPALAIAFDRKEDKVAASWQDAVSVFMLAWTPFIVSTVDDPRWCISSLSPILAGYVIYDALIYHVRVLWFDDLTPGSSAARSRVWSHRRIVFIAVANFVQSIFLLAVLQRASVAFAHTPYPQLLARSFTTATLLSAPDSLTAVDTFQIGISVFYLVIVIATTASVAYRRQEVDQ